MNEYFLRKISKWQLSVKSLKGKLLILKEITAIKIVFAFFYQTLKAFNTHILNIFANDLLVLNTLQ